MRGVKSRIEKLERRGGNHTSIVVDHIYIEPGQPYEESREHPEAGDDVLVVHSAIPPRDSEVR